MKIDKIICGRIENNNYVVIKGNDCLIIDVSDFKAVNNYIENSKLNVKGILLTHTHWDHLLGVQEFVEKYNVPIYLSSSRPNYISDANFDYTIQKYGIKTNFDIEKLDLIYLDEGNHNIDNFDFDIINVPGHTYCSIIYYFKKEKTMFTGDFLFRETIGTTETQLSNKRQMILSIRKIKEYNDDIIVLPGHGRDTTLGHEKKYNRFFI